MTKGKQDCSHREGLPWMVEVLSENGQGLVGAPSCNHTQTASNDSGILTTCSRDGELTMHVTVLSMTAWLSGADAAPAAPVVATPVARHAAAVAAAVRTIRVVRKKAGSRSSSTRTTAAIAAPSPAALPAPTCCARPATPAARKKAGSRSSSTRRTAATRAQAVLRHLRQAVLRRSDLR